MIEFFEHLYLWFSQCVELLQSVHFYSGAGIFSLWSIIVVLNIFAFIIVIVWKGAKN